MFAGGDFLYPLAAAEADGCGIRVCGGRASC